MLHCHLKEGKMLAFNKLKIIESVIKSEPHGMNTSELASEIGIHMTTVTRLCKPLVKNRFLMDKKVQTWEIPYYRKSVCRS